MIQELVPAAVASMATRVELDAELSCEEARSLGDAVDARRREFTTGRACARAALARLGVPATAIPRGADAQPLWPAGVVGSITHCRRYRACAVARDSDVRSIGIDAEVHAPLPPGVLAAVASARERRALPAAGAGVHADRLLFSAKEAVFKAWYPLTGRGLGFDDVVIEIDRRARTFHARLLLDGPVLDGYALTGFRGRWGVAGGIVATAVIAAR